MNGVLDNTLKDLQKLALKHKLLGNIDIKDSDFLIFTHEFNTVILCFKDFILQFRILQKDDSMYLRIDSNVRDMIIDGADFENQCFGDCHIVSECFKEKLSLGIPQNTNDGLIVTYNGLDFTCYTSRQVHCSYYMDCSTYIKITVGHYIEGLDWEVMKIPVCIKDDTFKSMVLKNCFGKLSLVK